jgi:hypothetical protein
MQSFIILGKLTNYPKNPPGIEALTLLLGSLHSYCNPSYTHEPNWTELGILMKLSFYLLIGLEYIWMLDSTEMKGYL